MFFGSTFHSVAAAWLKDLAAKVLYFTGGTLSIMSTLFDHMLSLFGLLILIKSMIYFGAVLFKPLFTVLLAASEDPLLQLYLTNLNIVYQLSTHVLYSLESVYEFLW